MIKMSKDEVSSYLGDVLPLSLIGEGLSYLSDVSWRVEGDAVSLREFDTDADFGIKNGVLISLNSLGEASVYAKYLGEEYVTRVTVREMLESDNDECQVYLRGDMHHHTSMNHKHDEFAKHENEDIPDYVDFMRGEGLLDFTVISDHAGVTNDRDFWRGFDLTEGTAPIIFAGAESEVNYKETNRFGIVERKSGEIVTMMSAGYVDSDDSYEPFEREMRYSKGAFAIFAHPHVVGFSTKGIWNFDYPSRTSPLMLSLMRGIEMGNGADMKENMLHEYAYPAALDAGFRVSPTCSSDGHGPSCGFYGVPGKTVVIAKENSKEAIHEAFLKNRFYATESGNVKLKYTVNGVTAPATIPPTDEYVFHIELDYFAHDTSTEPILLEIVSDYGKRAATVDVKGNIIDVTVRSDTARYFYLRLTDSEARKTWSYPVWCGREFDKKREITVEPIDLSKAMATVDGKECYTVINGDPTDYYDTGAVSPTVLIDLGKVEKVAAVGLYQRIIERQGKPVGWVTSDDSRSLVSRYEIYTSVDGKEYTLAASEVAKQLSGEAIVDFTPRVARYVRIDCLSNVGNDSRHPRYKGCPTAIGNIAIFKKST